MAAQLVAPGIHRFHSRFVNWYLVEDGERLAAIDAGLPPDARTLTEAIAALGRDLRQLEAVLVTHPHADHVGFAEYARREAGATVYVHEDDAELVGHVPPAAPSERSPLLYVRYPAARWSIWSMLRTAAFRGKRIRDVRTFRAGETLHDLPAAPRVVFTPGHTSGHSAFHLLERDVLFTGDALVTRNPYTGRLGPQIVSRAATADSEQALRSLDWIGETGASLLLPGHGAPWAAGADEAARLAREAGPS